MKQSKSKTASGRRRLVLRDLRPDLVSFDLVEGDERLRSVDVHVRFGRPQFPELCSEATESLGSDQADSAVRERAGEELVRLAAVRRRSW